MSSPRADPSAVSVATGTSAAPARSAAIPMAAVENRFTRSAEAMWCCRSNAWKTDDTIAVRFSNPAAMPTINAANTSSEE